MARRIALTFLTSTDDTFDKFGVGKAVPIQNIDDIGGFENNTNFKIGYDTESLTEYKVVKYLGKDVTFNA